ncbi:MAG: imidazole glycerol phosphate synthase subunit HisF [Gemmatimonadales bacterium]|nr:imidazole glycerol phosphate synthase subunit HisF [Gemmatimonadales bacterium]
MLRDRVIPCLLLRGSGFVKTRRFKKARYIGDAINALRIFNDKGADELIVVDIDASSAGYAPRMDMIRQLTDELFMPLTYGGGISTLEQVDEIIKAGVEKVAINTRNASGFDFVESASERLGAQSVVGVVDVAKDLLGRPRVVCRSGAQRLEGTPSEHARRLVDAGAGELLVQAVYKDGTRSGYDLALVKEVVSAVGVPVVALGGAHTVDDLAKVIVHGGAAAAAAGSMFVFHGDLDGVLINMPSEEAVTQAFQKARTTA